MSTSPNELHTFFTLGRVDVARVLSRRPKKLKAMFPERRHERPKAEMTKLRYGKGRITSSLFAVALLCVPGIGSSMGDPLFNLRLFFEDSARVHLDDASLIRQRHISQFGDLSEDEVASRVSIHPTHPDRLSESSTTCNDYQLTNYKDWLSGIERAKAARSEAKSNFVTPEMNWPGFLLWSSPSFAYVDIKRTYFGDLKRASVVLAISDESFDINSLLDREVNFFSQDTIEKLNALSRYGYDAILEYQLKGKKVRLSNKIECDGFQLFIMSVD
ncbi:MAG: hypothetical protein ACSHXH_17420 [Marivita sp.]|uniref:hypothetical protein n=1 Tax=Marivita sp. TaxID=2003365 RepID=UPI003EF56D47